MADAITIDLGFQGHPDGRREVVTVPDPAVTWRDLRAGLVAARGRAPEEDPHVAAVWSVIRGLGGDGWLGRDACCCFVAAVGRAAGAPSEVVEAALREIRPTLSDFADQFYQTLDSDFPSLP